eukprot:scaffold2433_cov159-Amphora_coffeaeformis.AAC.4
MFTEESSAAATRDSFSSPSSLTYPSPCPSPSSTPISRPSYYNYTKSIRTMLSPSMIPTARPTLSVPYRK